MFSQIETLLTNNSNSCITQANTLAFTNKQRTIHGEDLFWGISLFFKHHDLNAIFWKLLGVSEELLEEYFQSKYNGGTRVGILEEAKSLPLNKKIAQEITNRHLELIPSHIALNVMVRLVTTSEREGLERNEHSASWCRNFKRNIAINTVPRARITITISVG